MVIYTIVMQSSAKQHSNQQPILLTPCQTCAFVMLSDVEWIEVFRKSNFPKF